MALLVNRYRQFIFSAILKCIVLLALFSLYSSFVFSQAKDSAKILKTVKVSAPKKQNDFTGATPVQSLNNEELQQINAQSVGDAAKYFSGVLIKDYGGTGGFKTISVRSLGASNTGIVYDGIPVSDLQTGQIDLSRFSATFVQSLQLHQGSIQHSLMPARTYAQAAALAITTNTFAAKNFSQQNWQAGIKAGSFNLWQPFAGIYQPLKKNAVFSINAEALYSDGHYPINIDNGNYSVKTKRSNADIKSLQGEANLLKQFNDSSTLQVKTGGYCSARGLPGAIIFFNDRSAQRLLNTDFFAQSRYQKKINETTSLLVSAKYSHTYTRYTDPDFLNNQGGLDERYKQDEVYASIAASHYLLKNLLVCAASDIAFNKLSANKTNFASPHRRSLWENIALHYVGNLLLFDASLLYTSISDKTVTGAAASNKDKFMPSVALSIKPGDESPLLFRLFYKSVFRMPTFNDLYYNFVGNISLRPEFSKQYNAGITYTKSFNSIIKRFSISADAYYNQVKDKIIAVPSQNLFVWTMLNLGKVSIKGVDLNTEVNSKLSAAVGLFARIAYTWQNAIDITDKSSSSYKNTIPYTPDNSGSGLLSVNYKKWDAGYSMLFSGTRYILGDNNFYTELDGWMTHDVFVSRLIPLRHFNMHIKAEANNIFDERYDIVKYYPMPGRTFKISLLFNNL